MKTTPQTLVSQLEFEVVRVQSMWLYGIKHEAKLAHNVERSSDGWANTTSGCRREELRLPPDGLGTEHLNAVYSRLEPPGRPDI